jgi:hypothetical protein
MKNGPLGCRFEATYAFIHYGRMTCSPSFDGFVDGSRDSVSFLLTIQATGFLTIALVGLPPTEYARQPSLDTPLCRFIPAHQVRPSPVFGRVAPRNFTPRRSQIPDVNLSIHPARVTA